MEGGCDCGGDTLSDNEPPWGRPTDPWGNPLPDQPPSNPAGGLPNTGPGGPGGSGGAGRRGSSGTPAGDNWWGDPNGGSETPTGGASPWFPENQGFTTPGGADTDSPLRASTPPLAIISLVVAIAGFVVCGVVLSPLAVYLGYRARSRIDATGSSGRGLATAAIVVGIVGFLLNLAVLVMVLTNPDFLEQLDGAWSWASTTLAP